MTWPRARKTLPAFTLPEEFVITFPFGYRIGVVLRKRYDGHGGWVDFDEDRWGFIYVNANDPYDEQLDTLRHELEHALTDWGGKIRLLENEYREFRKEEEE